VEKRVSYQRGCCWGEEGCGNEVRVGILVEKLLGLGVFGLWSKGDNKLFSKGSPEDNSVCCVLSLGNFQEVKIIWKNYSFPGPLLQVFITKRLGLNSSILFPKKSTKAQIWNCVISGFFACNIVNSFEITIFCNF